MSNVHNLISRLDKVKTTGKNKWRACCPAHKGAKQSLAIRDDNGKVLIHCFAEGCAIDDILRTVGLSLTDIMPEKLGEAKANRKPFYAGDVLQISSDEIIVAYLIVQKMIEGTVSFKDTQRLLLCSTRLRHACDVANDGNGVPLMDVEKNQRVVERILNAC